MMVSPASKYVERYSQGVILRDNSLREYNHFLRNLGEKTPLEKIAAEYIQKNGQCRVLDIGCGNGQALHELKQHVGSLVHTMGVDLLPLHDAVSLDEFTQGDALDTPFPANCHLIVSFRALHEMGHFSTLLPRIAQSVARGGRAYLWIRMRDTFNGRLEWVGEMNAKEEEYLRALVVDSLRELNGCKVLVEPVLVPAPIQRENDPREMIAGGYVVLLMRP
jgi:SAM-dependent methyltransferase